MKGAEVTETKSSILSLISWCLNGNTVSGRSTYSKKSMINVTLLVVSWQKMSPLINNQYLIED